MGNSNAPDITQVENMKTEGTSMPQEDSSSFDDIKLESGGMVVSSEEDESLDSEDGGNFDEDLTEEAEADDMEEIFNLKALEKQPQKRLCFCHPDCFANQGNVCVALNDTRFGGAYCGGNCPFYKSEKQYVKERKATLKKLVDEGNSNLIYHYLKALDDWELEFLEELTKRGILGDLEGLSAELRGILEEADELEEEVAKLECENDELIPVYDDSDMFDEE